MTHVALAAFSIWLPFASLAEPVDKRGVAVANWQCPAVSAGWHYTWWQRTPQCGHSQGVPMIWCEDAVGLLPGTRLAMWGNEPDRSDQCNKTPTAAAQTFRALTLRYPQVRWVGPHVSQNGAAWLQAFVSEYRRLYGSNPPLWALGVHCYGDAGVCRAWTERNIAWAREWTATGTVWVTEFAMLPCHYPSADAARADADVYMAWLDAEPGVARYAWFGTLVRGEPPKGFGLACDTSLVDASGQATEWGRWYQRR